MPAPKKKPATIEEYIAASPVEWQGRLLSLHENIRKAAPGAIEAIKWGMPAYSYQKILVAFAVFNNHTGLYPMPSAMKAFAKQLGKYKTGKGSIQFPHDKALPLPLIRKIVKLRVKESEMGSIKWKS